MVVSLPLQLEAVGLDSVSFEGSRDLHGREFLAVKVGVRIPVQALAKALSELQNRFSELDTRPGGKALAAGAGSSSPDLDEGSKAQSAPLARTTTAPATCRGEVTVDTILEEGSDDAEGEGEEEEEEVTIPRVPLTHTVTHDPFMYEMTDATTWLPAAPQDDGAGVPVDAQGMPLPPPGMPPPLPPYLMHPMQSMVPPWGYAGAGWYDPSLDPGITPGLAFQHTLPPEQYPGGFDGAGVGAEPVAEPPAAKVQALRRTFSIGSNCMRVLWTLSAETLESTDSGSVESPNFDLALGDDCPSVPFRLRLWPDDGARSGSGLGGGSFQDTDGKGSVELVCADEVPDTVPDVKFRIAVGSGLLRQPARGPVCHNFEEASACGLPPDQAVWDFGAAVDSSSDTFAVCLEVLPARASMAASGSGARGAEAAARAAPEERPSSTAGSQSQVVGGPKVIVKNTFLDVDESQKPPAMLRTTTAPAQYQQQAAGERDEELLRRVCGQPVVQEEEDEEHAEEELPVPPLASELGGGRLQRTQFDRTATLDPYSYEASNPLTWLSEEGGAPAASSRAVPEPPPLRPQVVHRTFNVETGSLRLEWVVSSRKLASADTHAAVSPAFDLSFGESHPSVRFKMLIHPKVVDERKGGGSFKTAGGRGYVELAAEEMLPPDAPQVVFRVAIGTGQQRSPFRGPVAHDFSQKKVCGLPKDQALWNFNTVVDRETKTFVVCLEILPKGGEEAGARPTAEEAARPVGPKKW